MDNIYFDFLKKHSTIWLAIFSIVFGLNTFIYNLGVYQKLIKPIYDISEILLGLYLVFPPLIITCIFIYLIHFFASRKAYIFALADPFILESNEAYKMLDKEGKLVESNVVVTYKAKKSCNEIKFILPDSSGRIEDIEVYKQKDGVQIPVIFHKNRNGFGSLYLTIPEFYMASDSMQEIVYRWKIKDGFTDMIEDSIVTKLSPYQKKSVLKIMLPTEKNVVSADWYVGYQYSNYRPETQEITPDNDNGFVILRKDFSSQVGNRDLLCAINWKYGSHKAK